MSGIYRITGWLPITGTGRVYVLHAEIKDPSLRLGDVLMDLRMNRFRIKGFEMFRRTPDIPYDDREVCLLLENLDAVEPQGTILITQDTQLCFLFPASMLDPSKPDDSFKDEYKVCRRLWSCMLLNQEALDDGRVKLRGETQGLTIYRGWMLKPETYRLLYEALTRCGIILINSPQEYEYCHLLPKWYGDFDGHTPKSCWTEERDQAFGLLDSFEGSAIVKDWVKSRKHEWYEACFIRDVNDRKAAVGVIRRFIERQGDDMTGGVVLREYMPVRSIGWHNRSGMPISEEYRAFFLCGHLLSLDPYWDGQIAQLTDEEYECIKQMAAAAKSNFYTMDVARMADGSLTIMELGDGQVSGLQQLSVEVFYGKVREILSQKERGL